MATKDCQFRAPLSLTSQEAASLSEAVLVGQVDDVLRLTSELGLLQVRATALLCFTSVRGWS